MTMKASIPLIASSALAVGFAYFYWRGGRHASPSPRPQPSPSVPPRASSAPLPAALQMTWQDVIEVDVDLPEETVEEIDIDVFEAEERDADDDYAALSPGELGAAWLSRATQTEAAPPNHRESAPDILDPAGRPTDPDIALTWPGRGDTVSKDIWGGPLPGEKGDKV